MEALSVKHLISSIHANIPMRCHLTNGLSEGLVRFSSSARRVNGQSGHSRIIPWSKISSFQDFQGFAKPVRLLSVSKANTYTKYIHEDMLSSIGLDKSCSFYIVELRTSSEFGSCLRDKNAAILISLIDVNGDSILQRISTASVEHPGHEKEMVVSESTHFQRGSVDIVTFKGSKLGKIEAFWIGLESGSWRLDGVSLTVINGPLSLSSSVKDIGAQYYGLHYNFEENDILLGESRGLSMAELRPVHDTELPSFNFSALLNVDSAPPASLLDHNMSNEEGMREYADLKFSLLLYDLMLVAAGCLIVAFSTSEKAAFVFLIGGIGGFIYLLLLQRSVDGLSDQALSSMDGESGNFRRVFGGIKGPLSSLALILASTVAVVKYGLPGATMALTPTELIIAVLGFLTCKVAVVLAAVKPLQTSLKEKK